MSDNILYKKATMVLFSIEKSIGAYLASESSTLAEALMSSRFAEIRKRITGNISNTDTERLEQFLRVSYLRDILEMLKVACQGTSKENAAVRIFQCCEVLDVYDARNAIAHPIREFYPSHWYRIAAIASDPSLEEIGIVEPRAELDAAEDGDIREIDNTWWSRGERYLSNNLPEIFDHESTKLIGRSKELKELNALMISQRYSFISIVAPGGVGKTALALESLNSFVHNLSVTGKYECVLYVTLKQEELGLKGIRKLDSPNTIAALTERVDFYVKERGIDREAPILLCIDNLETLISDDVAAVESYIATLPETWKIVVTSRIPIDGAKTFPLGGLDESSSHILIRKYAASVGFSNIPTSAVERIAKGSAANPLALRLNVDKVNLGGDIADSIKQTEINLVDFSFRGLINALPPISRKILEVLFVVGSSDRGDIVSYFSEDSSGAASGIAKLLQTSIVRRILEGEDEKIELTDAIRILLQRSPLDLNFRHQASTRLGQMRRKNSQHSSIQESRKVNIYHEDYIGDWVPEHLASNLVDVIRFLRDNNPRYVDYSRITYYCNSLEKLPSEHKNHPEYWLMLARLRSWQRDEVSARSSFENAVKLEDTKERTRRPTARIAYAQYLRRINVLDESFDILSKLSDSEWCSAESSDKIVFRVIWGMLFDIAVKVSNGDAQNTLLDSLSKVTFGNSVNFYSVQESKILVSRAASKQKSSPSNVIDTYATIASKMRSIISCELYGKSAYLFVLFLLKEVSFLLRGLPVSLRGEQVLSIMFQNLENLIQEMLSCEHITIDERSLIREKLKEFIKFEVNFKNPFDSKSWRDEAGLQVVPDSEILKLERAGWVICKVTGVGSGHLAGHFFCKDQERTKYFVGRRNLVNLNLIEWAKVEVGHTVAIRAIEDGNKSGDYPSPREIFII